MKTIQTILLLIVVSSLFLQAMGEERRSYKRKHHKKSQEDAAAPATNNCLPLCVEGKWKLNDKDVELDTVTDIYKAYNAPMPECLPHHEPTPPIPYQPCEKRDQQTCIETPRENGKECVWIDDDGQGNAHGCHNKPEDCTADNYDHDESQNPDGKCTSNCDCKGKRICNENHVCEDQNNKPQPECTAEDYQHEEAADGKCTDDCDCEGKRTCDETTKTCKSPTNSQCDERKKDECTLTKDPNHNDCVWDEEKECHIKPSTPTPKPEHPKHCDERNKEECTATKRPNGKNCMWQLEDREKGLRAECVNEKKEEPKYCVDRKTSDECTATLRPNGEKCEWKDDHCQNIVIIIICEERTQDKCEATPGPNNSICEWFKGKDANGADQESCRKKPDPTCDSADYVHEEAADGKCNDNCDCRGKRLCNQETKVCWDPSEEPSNCDAEDYSHDESTNPDGKCTSDCQCSGKRTCNKDTQTCQDWKPPACDKRTKETCTQWLRPNGVDPCVWDEEIGCHNKPKPSHEYCTDRKDQTSCTATPLADGSQCEWTDHCDNPAPPPQDCSAESYVHEEAADRKCTTNCDCNGKRVCSEDNLCHDPEDRPVDPKCDQEDYTHQEQPDGSCASDCDCNGKRLCDLTTLKCHDVKPEIKPCQDRETEEICTKDKTKDNGDCYWNVVNGEGSCGNTPTPIPNTEHVCLPVCDNGEWMLNGKSVTDKAVQELFLVYGIEKKECVVTTTKPAQAAPAARHKHNKHKKRLQLRLRFRQ